MSEDVFEIPEYILAKWAEEKKFIKQVGERIGYGRIMQIGQELWREQLEEMGLAGGEFASGPCVASTVPCGCKDSCGWCCGAGWLTEHVKAVKDKMENE